eukprot:TRINITY_DN66423_c0_g1_i1.p1 TRINITY_DN66423_c0_g1~~TRINITY_DN66423_c0_g1_i1.p1  ORF type:complete len:254 (+),score=110.12 TRINITY_DN66423_c0_g1_i1:313-1074(+)
MARVTLTCNDSLLFSLLAFSIATLVVRWDTFSECSAPLPLFLLVDYATIALFRVAHLLVKWAADQPQWLRRALYIFKVGVVYTFFVAWTIVGSVWLDQSGDCLPEKNQYWTFVVWLVLCYLWSALYLCVIVLQRMLVPDHVNGAGAGAGAGGAGAQFMVNAPFPLSLIHLDEQLGLPEDQIQVIRPYPAPVDKLSDDICAICLEGYCRDQPCKKLPNCTHSFHAHCIDNWLRRKSDCPICRTPVVVHVHVDVV